MLQEGTWWLESKSDSRWNITGSGLVGMFGIPPKAQEAIEQKKKELGEDHPGDLRYGYMKD